jgi:prepilin-type N-terminal cleavage/methylation domain-containing protein
VRPKAEAGFTLVEVLTSIVILSFGLIAVTNLFLVAGNSNLAANAGTAAAAIASEQMETLKATRYDLLAAGGSLTSNAAGYFRDSSNDARLRIPGAGSIRVRWTIADVPGNAQLKHVVVRAEAETGFLGARTRAEFTTFRACTDPVPQATTASGCSGNAPQPCCPAAP